MKVLVSGANGYVGVSAVRALARAGHTVFGLVRSPEKGVPVVAARGQVVVGDVLDPRSLEHAVRGMEAIVHLANAHGPDAQKVRAFGARNLIRAAKGAGVRQFILGSGYWLHGSRRGTITEETPTPGPGPSINNLRAEEEAVEAHRAHAIDATIVRPGMAYGTATWFPPMVKEIREGTYRYPGRGSNHWSPVHIDDVGEAYRVILERGAAGHAYLVVDDEPVPVRSLAAFIATEIGATLPKGKAPSELGRTLDPDLVKVLSMNQAASNAKLRRLGWRPEYPTYREGVPPVLRELRYRLTSPEGASTALQRS